MNKKESVKLSDYRSYPFNIPTISIDFNIHDEYVIVSSLMQICPVGNPDLLVLKGISLELMKISIDNKELDHKFYKLSESELIINTFPNKSFKLEIKTRIDPYLNYSLEGLFLSGEILATQCEAEGFRRICFHPDRPDVLSKYEVRIEANIKKYPVLLSNGNHVISSVVSNDNLRHYVVWNDPFPKPSYLFAIVAGKLKQVKDFYITSSGKKVDINIYVESGDQTYTKHAIQSLKKAMKWDELKYEVEYDLEQYNIVAVRHFNMGAMENKGLNIFNSKLILADYQIATDDELTRIEGVIAHEYFHNWSGNRVTCRDWFQLSLKEGLTVFRDQCFTADLHSSAVKRIEDVSFLRNTQFVEDSGATSHPVKPVEYFAIDNFYTTTIYEKGSELIRMLFNILGEENFQKGIKLYFQRFDGSFATTEDLVQLLIEIINQKNNKELFRVEDFLPWYYLPGTPEVNISREWDSSKGRLTLKITQNIPILGNESEVNAFIIPIKIGLIYSNGKRRAEELFLLDKSETNLILDNLPKDTEIPVLSLFRGFSAPVNWKADHLDNEYISLIKYDDDPFSRWDASQILMRKILLLRSNGFQESSLEEDLINSFDYLINNLTSEDYSFLSMILTPPSVNELELYQKIAQPISLYEAIIDFQKLLGSRLKISLQYLLDKLELDSLKTWPEGIGARKMKCLIWKLLALSGDKKVISKAFETINLESMTLVKGALNALHPIDCTERELALDIFYERWKNSPIILDSWFRLEASIPRKDSLQRVHDLLKHQNFDPLVPNTMRAIIGGFAENIPAFHSSDGSGYQFLAEQIIAFDKINPITSSRFVKLFSRWKHYSESNRKLIYNSLDSINKSDISINTREILEAIIKK